MQSQIQYHTTRTLQTIKVVIILLISLLLLDCEQAPFLERLKTGGVLKVATVNSPTTFYEGAESLEGLEYELADAFGKSLGLSVEFVVYRSDTELIKAVQNGAVHMIAAGLTITEERAKNLAYSVPYQQIEQKLIYKRWQYRPKSLDDLQGKLLVPENSSYDHKLKQLKQAGYPNLQWQTTPGASIDDVLDLLNSGKIEYTIADANQIALKEAYYAHIKEAFTLPEKAQLAWAFSPAYDDSLIKAANRFLTLQKENGKVKPPKSLKEELIQAEEEVKAEELPTVEEVEEEIEEEPVVEEPVVKKGRKTIGGLY